MYYGPFGGRRDRPTVFQKKACVFQSFLVRWLKRKGASVLLSQAVVEQTPIKFQTDFVCPPTSSQQLQSHYFPQPPARTIRRELKSASTNPRYFYNPPLLAPLWPL